MAAYTFAKEIETMIMTNKLLPVALVAALIGGSVGAFVMHSRNQSTTANTAATPAYSTSADTQFARSLLPRRNKPLTSPDSLMDFDLVKLELPEIKSPRMALFIASRAHAVLLVRVGSIMTINDRAAALSGKSIAI